MSKSRIPSISVKRPHGASDLDSQLPRYKKAATKSPLAEITNTAGSSPQVLDINCNMSAKTAFTPTTTSHSARLMNKYYYGDPRVIEEVKRRERKVLKDIQHFRKGIDDIEKDMTEMQKRTIPELRYDLNKKATVFKDLRADMSQIDTKLELLNNKCNVMRANNELALKNITLEQDLEVQKLENELDQEINTKREEWELKLLSLENMKPEEGLTKEIEELKLGKAALEHNWDALQRANIEKCKEYEKTLEKEFSEFKDQKMALFQELSIKFELLSQELNDKQIYADKISDSIDECKMEKEKVEREIEACMKELHLSEGSIHPLEKQSRHLQEELENERKQTALVAEKTAEVEAEHEFLFSKMEEQQLSRKKIENTIEELRGCIRCFAYVDDSVLPCAVDYSSRTITTRDSKQFSFSKIIPQQILSAEDLFEQECQAYMDMCLQNRYDSTIISLQQDKDNSIISVFIKWLMGQVYDHAEFQCVMLSEKSVSCDMILPGNSSPNHSDNSEIKVVIDDNSVAFESRSVVITSKENSLTVINQLKKKTSEQSVIILKFKIWHDEQSSHNVHFVDVPKDMSHCLQKSSASPVSSNRSSLASLASSSPLSSSSSPISVILRKLLTNTKPLILLSLKYEDYSLLDIAQQVSRQKRISC
ncbi:HER156Wp [Eremothecium sinecaudum]|uniref:HER156Wp n=1 Tax=Eremothecium sinecaudum TaxID=45286 RepID=A0A109UZH3_9SACH|nr:HER156Wp [Eremothecium sinecaudum]AMD21435.1 HER156Wp [Eremothecium sinecaudum]